jgi:hypothetical protein
MAVLKLCVIQGLEACNLGIPILAEKLATPNGGVATVCGVPFRDC